MTTDSPASRVSAPRRGVNGAILKAWRAKETRLRVIGREEVAPTFLRIQVDAAELLRRDDVYPTYWLRLWFTTPAGKGHQRAYTVVSPDHEAGTAWLEFYLHDGVASDWARDARPGDEIEASILNSRSPIAGDPPHLVMVGDGASAPAIADTLRRAPGIPATVLLERGHADDPEVLPVAPREGASIAWFDRDGGIEEAALEAAAQAPAGTSYFVSLEGGPTRRISSALRRQRGIPRDRIHSLAYWKQT